MVAHHTSRLLATAAIASLICAGVLGGGAAHRTVVTAGNSTGTKLPTLQSSCTCPFAVFSVRTDFHSSHNNPELINFTGSGAVEFANDSDSGDVLIGNSTFVAPLDGYYVFSFTGEKDTFYGNPVGTEDDVWGFICKNGDPSTGQILGSAWSGEGDGRRGQMAATTAVHLVQGDTVQVYAHSDGIPAFPRSISLPHFTGFLLRAD